MHLKQNFLAMKKLIILVALLIGFSDLSAQQEAMYTQYMFNGVLLNPAYAGSRGGLSATAFYRNQWTGFEGAPTTFSVAAHSPFKKRVGLGISFEGDAYGPISTYNMALNYAYHIPLSTGSLSIGLRGSFMNFNADYSEAKIVDGTDNAFEEDVNRWMPNFGAGLYYHSQRLVIGVGIPKLLENKINKDGSNESISKLSSLERHYYATIGMIFPLAETIHLRPSALLRYNANAPLSFEVGANLIYKDAFWIGASYRTNSSVNFNLMYQINDKVRLGYAYDLGINEINQYSSGSHEIMLGYDLRRAQDVISPRYF